MSRRRNSAGLVCAGCGQDIHEEHEFRVKKRGEKGYNSYHRECLHLVEKGKAKKDDR